MFATSFSRENLWVDKSQKLIGDPRLTSPKTETLGSAPDTRATGTVLWQLHVKETEGRSKMASALGEAVNCE
jgi:hypothetical protein